MFREQMFIIRDDRRASMLVGGLIGLFSGLMISFITVIQNTRPSSGFFGTLATNTVGVSVILTVALVCGAAIGLLIGLIEGAIAYAFAQVSAQRFHSLVWFSLVTGVVFAIVNGAITALCAAVAYGASGVFVDDSWAPIAAMVLTVIAVLAFSRLNASDWPQADHRVAASANRSSYVEVIDLNSAESMQRYSRLANQRNREKISEYDSLDDDFYQQPIYNEKEMRRRMPKEDQ